MTPRTHLGRLGPAGLALALAFVACTSTDAVPRDAAADGPDGAAPDGDAAPLPRDLANGASCATSSQCLGGCCELHRGNTFECAQITPFDTAQGCTCTADEECAAIKPCGEPGFCQTTIDPLIPRFCSRACK